MSSISTTCSTSFSSTSTSTSTARLFDRLSSDQQGQIEALEGYADSLIIDGSNASSVLSSIDKHIAEMLKDKALWENSEYELIGVQKQVAGMRWTISQIPSSETTDLSLDKEGLRLVIDRISKTTRATMFLNRDKLYMETVQGIAEALQKRIAHASSSLRQLNFQSARDIISYSIQTPSQQVGEYGELIKEFNTILRAGITSYSIMINGHLIELMLDAFFGRRPTDNVSSKSSEGEAVILMDLRKKKIQSLVKYGLDLNFFTHDPQIHAYLVSDFINTYDVEKILKWLPFLVDLGLNINLRWNDDDVPDGDDVPSVKQSILERILSSPIESLDYEEINERVMRVVRTCVFLGATADDTVIKASANSFPLAYEQYAHLRHIRMDVEERNKKENIVKGMQECLQGLLLTELVGAISHYVEETSQQELYDKCEQEYERRYPSTSSSSRSTTS